MNTTQIASPSLSTSASAAWLRPVLVLDAGVSGLNGVAYLAAASYLSDLLGPSTVLLQGLGLFLVVWAAGLAIVATRNPLPVGVVREIGYANLLWVAGSIVVAAGLVTLTGIGLAWCLLQTVSVTLFAGAQIVGTRR